MTDGGAVHESEQLLEVGGNRSLHVYEARPEGPETVAVVWFHGTPNLGAPPAPLYPEAERLGVRWVSYDRPGYGGSTPRPGRDIASAAEDVRAVTDALGITRFAVLGHSGGGTHALACAALLPDRVSAAVSICGVAPYGAPGLDWFGGMAPSGVASLTAATNGRAAKERHEASAADSDPGFIEEDWAELSGDWSWFGGVVAPAVAAGPAALIDDDLAYVAPWGFDPATIKVPVLLLHGERDLMIPSSHSRWLASHIPSADLWLRPGHGHISVLRSAPEALAWLVERARVGAGAGAGVGEQAGR